MAKTWYPVIDYSLCTECGSCIDMCRHGVYDRAKAPVPSVIYIEGCIQGCRGCASRCPVDAISYVGDRAKGDAECNCGCGTSSKDCSC